MFATYEQVLWLTATLLCQSVRLALPLTVTHLVTATTELLRRNIPHAQNISICDQFPYHACLALRDTRVTGSGYSSSSSDIRGPPPLSSLQFTPWTGSWLSHFSSLWRLLLNIFHRFPASASPSLLRFCQIHGKQKHFKHLHSPPILYVPDLWPDGIAIESPCSWR